MESFTSFQTAISSVLRELVSRAGGREGGGKERRKEEEEEEEERGKDEDEEKMEEDKHKGSENGKLEGEDCVNEKEAKTDSESSDDSSESDSSDDSSETDQNNGGEGHSIMKEMEILQLVNQIAGMETYDPSYPEMARRACVGLYSDILGMKERLELAKLLQDVSQWSQLWRDNDVRLTAQYSVFCSLQLHV